MLEVLLLVTGLGLLLSGRHSMGVVNPFRIYFLVWFLLFLGYAVTRHTFVDAGVEFLFAMLCSMSVATVLLVANSMQRSRFSYPLPSLETVGFRRAALILAQLATSAALVPVLARAQMLSGAESIFTGIGYMRLRYAMTQEGQGFGVLAYFFILSFVLSSVSVARYRAGKVGLALLMLSVLTSIMYAYVSTGRTFVLLLFCLVFAPLVITRTVRGAGMAAVMGLLAAAFIVIGALASKGIDIEVGLLDAAEFFLQSLRSYTIAPLLAFSQVLEGGIDSDYGANTFRFVVSVTYAIGLTETPPVELVKEFAYVPDMTNVYTVYEPYVRDFLAIGILVPPAFLIMHEWLFRKASRRGGRWIFYYAASIYPLMMQFFQDQYMSLLSQWIQISFWYVVFVKPVRQVAITAVPQDA